MNNALGLVEAIGRAAAIVAVDTILKAANVTLIGIEPSKGGGMYAIKIEGDVGAVKAAVDSIKSLDELQNKILASKVIPRPAAGIDKLIYNSVTIGYEQKVEDAILEVIQEEVKEAAQEKVEVITEDKIQNPNEVIPETSSVEPVEIIEAAVSESKEEVVETASSSLAVEEEAAEAASTSAVKEEIKKKKTEKESTPIKVVKTESKSTKKEVICNLCNDPKCERKRGEPKNLCIHYNTKST